MVGLKIISNLRRKDLETGRRIEREAIIFWLNNSAAEIMGGALSGKYKERECEAAAEIIELAAACIAEGHHREQPRRKTEI